MARVTARSAGGRDAAAVRRPGRTRMPAPWRRVGAVVWPSFFSAAVATMVAFALVDPAELGHALWLDVDLDRKGAYTLGFFALWVCTLASSLFTSILLRRPRGAV